jgi:hypothetical protein
MFRSTGNKSKQKRNKGMHSQLIKKNRRRQTMNVLLKERTNTMMFVSIDDEQNESTDDKKEEADEGEPYLHVGKNKDGSGGRNWHQCRAFEKDPSDPTATHGAHPQTD